MKKLTYLSERGTEEVMLVGEYQKRIDALPPCKDITTMRIVKIEDDNDDPF